MEKRYRFLRAFSVILKIFAWLVLIASIIIGLVFMVMGGTTPAPMGGEFSRMGGVITGFLVGIISLIAGIIYFLTLYAGAELILVLLSIEESTRKSVSLLSRSE
jgi:hypothetical protein